MWLGSIQHHRSTIHQWTRVNHSSVDYFSFVAFRAGCYDKESIELLIDSGCNSFMVKNKELFSDLDEGFLADVCNANSSRSEIRGRGTVRCFVKDNTGRSCLLELRDAFWVPSYARNLVSVKRLTDKGAMIQFNDDPTIKMPIGTVVPMMTNDELFSVMAQPVETGSLAMMSHSIKHLHRVMGHNNDVPKLQQEFVGMNISGSEKKTNCNICCTEKAKRASIPKTWGTRAKTKLAIVRTDVLGHIQQESYQSFRYAVGFIDSYSRFGAVYPTMSKDEVTANYNHSSSMLAGLAFWSQTGLSSSSQSSSVTCAHPMASNRSSLHPTHPKKTTKLS